MNNCIFKGNVTKDIEVKETQTTKVAKFTIAVNEGYGENKTTAFINCVAFNKTAEAMGKFVKKGTPLLIRSSYKPSSYTNQQGETKYTHEFIVREVEFLNPKSQTGESAGYITGEEAREEVPF